MINRFNTNSYFIYDINEYKTYTENIKELNRLKLTNKESLFLKGYIDKSKVQEEINNNNLFITLDKSLADELFNLYKKPGERSSLELFKLSEYSKSENRTNFTCRKLLRKYSEITNIVWPKSPLTLIIFISIYPANFKTIFINLFIINSWFKFKFIYINLSFLMINIDNNTIIK